MNGLMWKEMTSFNRFIWKEMMSINIHNEVNFPSFIFFNYNILSFLVIFSFLGHDVSFIIEGCSGGGSQLRNDKMVALGSEYVFWFILIKFVNKEHFYDIYNLKV